MKLNRISITSDLVVPGVDSTTRDRIDQTEEIADQSIFIYRV